MGVEDHEERIVGLGQAKGRQVVFAGLAAQEKDQYLVLGVLPVGRCRLRAIGPQPSDVLDVGARYRAAVEEPVAVEDYVVEAQANQLPDRLGERLAVD